MASNVKLQICLTHHIPRPHKQPTNCIPCRGMSIVQQTYSFRCRELSPRRAPLPLFCTTILSLFLKVFTPSNTTNKFQRAPRQTSNKHTLFKFSWTNDLFLRIVFLVTFSVHVLPSSLPTNKQKLAFRVGGMSTVQQTHASRCREVSVVHHLCIPL